ncbi:MAG TPA: ABC transporter permease [Blastocatellia bacterium]|nr:ABC transporter permease [Blastocatellia bacterium]
MQRKLLLLAGQYLFLLLLVIGINFFVVYLAPGDAVDVISRGRAETGDAGLTEQEAQMLRQYYGLDQPLSQQFTNYLKQLARGDLGWSFFYHRPAGEIIRDYAGRTMIVVVTGMVLALLIGLPLGILSAARRGQPLDAALLVSQIVLHSMPPFFIATLLLIVFAVELQWLPFSGSGSVQSNAALTGFAHLSNTLYHLTLPALSLAIWESTTIYYFTRNTLIDILSEDFILTAKAKGLSARAVLLRHALRVALPTLIARFALMIGVMVGGIFFVEQVFSYPGIASLALTAFHNHDYLLLRGIFLWLTIAILGANFVADVLMYLLDPRTRAMI